MKQIYLQSYFKSGYSRFMQYINNVLEHPQRVIIEKRMEIIKFYDEFGARATRKAFRKGRSTIYLWKHKLRIAGGKLSALAPGNRAPQHKRKHITHPFITQFIIDYRTRHPGVDKTTITPVLCSSLNLI